MLLFFTESYFIQKILLQLLQLVFHFFAVALKCHKFHYPFTDIMLNKV